MRKSMLVVSLAVASAVGSVACGGEDENPNPNPPRNQQPTVTLSSGYTTHCARCHGEKGAGQTIAGVFYPALPNGRDEAGYIATVRAGKNDMPAFTATDISDADLKADYAALTAAK